MYQLPIKLFIVQPTCMGVGSGVQGAVAPYWIFIHDTNIIDKSFKSAIFRCFFVIFGLFSVAPPPERGLRLNSAIFRSFFFIIFRSFFCWPLPGIFSVDALAYLPSVYPACASRCHTVYTAAVQLSKIRRNG